MATRAEYAWATLRRARDSLGIKPSKTHFDGGWEWALPPKMLTKTHEDAHTPQVEHCGAKNGQKPHWNATLSEDAHPEHFRQNLHPRVISGAKSHEDAQAKTASTFGDGQHLREMPADDAEYEVEV
jgi:hypothetical protein